MDKIIKLDQQLEHSVQKYQFKKFDTDNTLMASQKIETTPASTPKENLMKPKENTFSKELLAKSEELSLNLAKIQTQMQKQQEDFDKRLELEMQKSFEAGKAEGIKKISEDIANQNDELKNQFLKSITSLAEQHNQINALLEKIEKDLPKLAIMIAKKVIKKELDENSSKITKSITESLMENLKDVSHLLIKVNPADFQYIKKSFTDDKYLKVKSDDAIAKGGVVIISDGGNIDANLPTRIEKVIELIEKDY